MYSAVNPGKTWWNNMGIKSFLQQYNKWNIVSFARIIGHTWWPYLIIRIWQLTKQTNTSHQKSIKDNYLFIICIHLTNMTGYHILVVWHDMGPRWYVIPFARADKPWTERSITVTVHRFNRSCDLALNVKHPPDLDQSINRALTSLCEVRKHNSWLAWWNMYDSRD